MNQTRTFLSKKEYVYFQLRDQILTAQLQPGARLIIDDLAIEMGVSPIPVREALQMLQSDGLVTIEPYQGANVSEVPPELVQEVFALLEALEVVSGCAACHLMTSVDFAQMEAILCRMDGNMDDPEEWSQDNIRLHRFICERAGMQLVQDLLQRVVDHWNRLRRLYLKDVFVGRVSLAQQDHWDLLAALRTRDPERVTHAIRAHNQKALTAYLSYLEKSGAIEPRPVP